MDTVLPRSSAVLLLLFDRDDETWLVLTKRTHRVATHKGQISLPGGAREPFDESLLHTALRETQEELGISSNQMVILGALEEVFTVVSNFNISPFIARLASPPTYRPDPGEVAEVIEVPLSFLRKPDLFWTEQREGPDGYHEVYFFRYGNHIIWGATARILRLFLDSPIPWERVGNEA